ncbi:MAG: hypothetical protein K2Q06_00875 [Parvularculaceae bacterium]|nr:hypothetical protein [Parvularculaceae bacterium]
MRAEAPFSRSTIAAADDRWPPALCAIITVSATVGLWALILLPFGVY